MRNEHILTGKSIETYACEKDSDNPIATLIEALIKDPVRKQRLLDSGDPRAAIEQIKKYIALRRQGEGENASWMYMCYIPQFDLHIRVMATTRLAEQMAYNPF